MSSFRYNLDQRENYKSNRFCSNQKWKYFQNPKVELTRLVADLVNVSNILGLGTGCLRNTACSGKCS